MIKDEERIENIASNVREFIAKEEKSMTKIKDIEQKVSNLENYLLRPDGVKIMQGTEQKTSMEEYIRKGIIDNLLTKSLGSNEGKLLITPTLYQRIIGAIKEKSIMRTLASVETISTNALDVVIENGGFKAGWVDEEDERVVTDTPRLAVMRIAVHELYSQPKATQRLLDDSAINIEDWLVERLADSFASSENEAFIRGDGKKKPKGIILSENIRTVEFKDRTRLLDLLLDLINNLPEEHMADATFLMNRTTLSVIQALKDDQGRLIWQTSLSDSLKQTILGVPVVCSPHVIEIDKAPLIILANFKAAYKIVDRSDMQLMRDPYTDKPFVKFYATKRVGGDVINPSAMIMAKLISSQE